MPADQIPEPLLPPGADLELALLAERDARLAAEVLAQEAAQRAERVSADLAAALVRHAAETERLAQEKADLKQQAAVLQHELTGVRGSRWWRLATASHRARKLVTGVRR